MLLGGFIRLSVCKSLFTTTSIVMYSSLSYLYMGTTWPKKELIKVFRKILIIFWIQKISSFLRSHFYYIFNNLDFLVHITSKIMSGYLLEIFMLVGPGQMKIDYIWGKITCQWVEVCTQ